ncbi:hypothetical protein ACP4OV_016234 [Aristida adscensionis]
METVPKEQEQAGLYDNLMMLRAVTHSDAVNNISIIANASMYIKDLKQKIEKLNEEIASSETSPLVSVEVVEKGFLINVFMGKNSPGLLASILEAFDKLGLTVLEARATCSGSFRLEAVGGEDKDEGLVDACAVEEAVLQAIKSCLSN